MNTKKVKKLSVFLLFDFNVFVASKNSITIYEKS